MRSFRMFGESVLMDASRFMRKSLNVKDANVMLNCVLKLLGFNCLSGIMVYQVWWCLQKELY